MKFVRRLWPYAAIALCIAAISVFWLRYDDILDWMWLHGYEPNATVQRLADATAMTPYAKRLFYVNKPSVEDKEAFNHHCNDPSAEVAVLGCYTGDRRGIYIYNVADSRLNGIHEVTAAHEMLHQAYDRLHGNERKRINDLLQTYYDQQAPKALKDEIEPYKKTEPNELHNEMHSIFGTDAQTLPDELEAYYAKYFTNRQRIVQLRKQYQAEFDNRRAQIVALNKQLADLKVEIENKKQWLESREKTMQDLREQMDRNLNGNNIAAYNAAVPGYNTMVVSYRSEISKTNALINQYNNLLKQLNDISVEERELQRALDSNVNAAPSE
ncbi:MAG TPA: hypothetical protein VJ836_03195 [Candidatus Saccharimonadales bacterium]|nr:hypothetical protein [Candidatus Saccharimonadales bacterium]